MLSHAPLKEIVASIFGQGTPSREVVHWFNLFRIVLLRPDQADRDHEAMPIPKP
jgi:hypothetical protein